MSSENKTTNLRPVSMADSEKTMEVSAPDNKKEIPESGMQSESSSERKVTVDAKAENLEKNSETITAAKTTTTPEDDFEYPKAWALSAIVLGLCLAVFCMALVCPISLSSLRLVDEVDWRLTQHL